MSINYWSFISAKEAKLVNKCH